MKKYESPEMEIIVFDRADLSIITDSSNEGEQEPINSGNSIGNAFSV